MDSQAKSKLGHYREGAFKTEKQIAVISALAEGSGFWLIERMMA